MLDFLFQNDVDNATRESGYKEEFEKQLCYQPWTNRDQQNLHLRLRQKQVSAELAVFQAPERGARMSVEAQNAVLVEEGANGEIWLNTRSLEGAVADWAEYISEVTEWMSLKVILHVCWKRYSADSAGQQSH